MIVVAEDGTFLVVANAYKYKVPLIRVEIADISIWVDRQSVTPNDFMMNMGVEDEIPLTVYKGVFAMGEDGKIPPNASVTVSDNETGDMFGVYKPRSDNGSFVLILHPGNNYNIAYEADGYMYRSEKLFVPENTAYFEINRTIELKKMVLKRE